MTAAWTVRVCGWIFAAAALYVCAHHRFARGSATAAEGWFASGCLLLFMSADGAARMLALDEPSDVQIRGLGLFAALWWLGCGMAGGACLVVAAWSR